MKERDHSVVAVGYDMHPEKVIEIIEKEVKSKWDQGWLFVVAEPDRLFESVRLTFEREIYV